MPIERSTPYSQIASLMFCVIEIKSRKKAIERAITAMIATKILKIISTDFAVSWISFFVRRKPDLL